jgi:hypothetical protein
MGIRLSWIVVASGVGFLLQDISGAVVGLIIGVLTSKIVWAAIMAIKSR